MIDSMSDAECIAIFVAEQNILYKHDGPQRLWSQKKSLRRCIDDFQRRQAGWEVTIVVTAQTILRRFRRYRVDLAEAMSIPETDL